MINERWLKARGDLHRQKREREEAARGIETRRHNAWAMLGKKVPPKGWPIMHEFKPSFDHMGEEYAILWSDAKKVEVERERQAANVSTAIPNPWSN